MHTNRNVHLRRDLPRLARVITGQLSLTDAAKPDCYRVTKGECCLPARLELAVGLLSDRKVDRPTAAFNSQHR